MSDEESCQMFKERCCNLSTFQLFELLLEGKKATSDEILDLTPCWLSLYKSVVDTFDSLSGDSFSQLY